MQVSDPAFCLLTSVTKLPRRRKLTCDGPASLLIFRANWLIKDDHFFAQVVQSVARKFDAIRNTDLTFRSNILHS